MSISEFKPKYSRKYVDNYASIFKPTLFQRIKNWFRKFI